MLKKPLAIVLLFAFSTTLAYAATKQVYYKERVYYKGELPPPPVRIIPHPEDFPCKTYPFYSAFYVGFGPEIRTNYTRTGPTVFKGFDPLLFAGYAYVRDNFYLGTEIFAQYSSSLQNYTQSVNANGNPIGVKTTWDLGFSFLPGVIWTDTLMTYLRLGAIYTRFADVAEEKMGGQIGLGLQSSVSEHWDARFEYSYAFYPTIAPLSAPRSDTYQIGVLYKI